MRNQHGFIGLGLWSGITRFITFTAPAFLGMVFAILGLVAVTYTGIDAGLDALNDAILLEYSQLPSDVLSILAIAKVDVALKTILSALTTTVTLKTLSPLGKPIKRYFFT